MDIPMSLRYRDGFLGRLLMFELLYRDSSCRYLLVIKLDEIVWSRVWKATNMRVHVGTTRSKAATAIIYVTILIFLYYLYAICSHLIW